MHRSRHRLLLAVGLIAGVVAARAAEAQTGTGTMNVHLGVPAGKTLTESTITVINTSIGFSNATVHFTAAGPFVVTPLPVADGYTASVVASTTDGDVCNGSTGGIPIVTNGTTIAFVNLATCLSPTAEPVPALGRFAPLLGLSLALLGAIAGRRRGHGCGCQREQVQ